MRFNRLFCEVIKMEEQKLNWKQITDILNDQFIFAENKHKDRPNDSYWEGVFVALQAVTNLLTKAKCE